MATENDPTMPATPLPARASKTSTAPGANGQRQETTRLVIRLAAVAVLTACVLGYALLAGKDLTVEQILLIVGAGAALAGLTVAARPGGTGTTIAGAGLLVITSLLGGCGAGPLVHDQNPNDGIEPCELEASIVDGLASALDDVDAILPDDLPKAEDGMGYARGVVEEGRGAIAACRALTEERGSGLSAVIPWLTAAANVVRGIIAILTAAHVDLPDSIMGVLHSLGLAQAELGVDVELEVVAKGGPS